MLKKALIASAFALACPAFVFAQDFSVLFGGSLPGAGGGSTTNTLNITGSATSGSVNIYAAPTSLFDGADLNFFSSNPSVVSITGGEAFDSVLNNDPTMPNPNASPTGFRRFDFTEFDASSPTAGNLFSVSLMQRGIDPSFPELGLDPFFDPTDGFLLARVDYDIVGVGTTEFSLELGDLGVFLLPANPLSPSFGSATLTVNVPEPSSAVLLMMSSVVMIVRRKRV